MAIQTALGSDIAMAFDECPPSDAPRPVIEAAVARTTRWARLCRGRAGRAGTASLRHRAGRRPRGPPARAPRGHRRHAVRRPRARRARRRRGARGHVRGHRRRRARDARRSPALPDGRRDARGHLDGDRRRRRHVRLRDADAQRAQRPAVRPRRAHQHRQRAVPGRRANPSRRAARASAARRTAAATCRTCSARRSCCTTGWRASTISSTTWAWRGARARRSSPGHFPRRRGSPTRMAKRVGVLLSGCGRLDGSDVAEAMLTLLMIERAGAQAICAAPDADQAGVVDHLTGEGIRRRPQHARRGGPHRTAGRSAVGAEREHDRRADRAGRAGSDRDAVRLSRQARALSDPSRPRRLLRAMLQSHRPMGFVGLSALLAARVLGPVGRRARDGRPEGDAVRETRRGHGRRRPSLRRPTTSSSIRRRASTRRPGS